MFTPTVPSCSLLENLWVLEKQSGICLFEKSFVENQSEKISVDLASAFLTAISSFVDETFSDGIQSIDFQKRKIHFRFRGRLLFIFIFSKSVKSAHRAKEKLMNRIIDEFYEQYQHILDEQEVLSNISQFSSFSDKLEEILESKSPLDHLLTFLYALNPN
ncbi:MAG: hypothetical protein EU548_01365 [Promethearchaeota archaeon]|nr:MAG: hypothetical protein EU548_01365 [Candidatus Lokiarchaeota archaeon]